MIDLSFLTEEEQEAIMKVLQRDAELKRAEEERVRHLREKIKDNVQLKNMSGQWFYEAKSKRHRDKIHGADIIRASMRRKPATIADVSQNKTSKAKTSWVSNVNKEVFVPPDLHGIVEHQEEQQLQTGSRSKEVTPVLDKPEERPIKAAISSVKQRRNPFNSTASGDNLNSGESENRSAIGPQLSKKEILSLSEESPPKSNLQNDETEKPKKPSVELTDESQKELVKRPIPKARKLIHKAADPVLQREDFVPKPSKTERINGIGSPPRGILKRSSSSSSTDSEVRVSQMLDVQKKNGLSTATIFEGEGEKNCFTEEAENSTQISLEKLKQVRFSSSTGKGKPLQSPQLHHGKERREFDLLKPDKKKNSENYAVQSDSLGDKQISPVKPLGTCSPTLQMKAIDGLQEDTSASNPCDTNRSVLLVSETLQTQTVTPKKLETPQKTSSNILPNSNNELSVDETSENKSNQILSHESKSHKQFTDEHQLSAKTEAREVSITNSTRLQQGKPDLAEERDAKTTFKPGKHADELMKVDNESVSKVLDWFKRSSSTEDGEHISMRSQGMEPQEEVDLSTRTTVLPTEHCGPSMCGKTEDTEELPFGKIKQGNSNSSPSFTSENIQLVKERTKPKAEEANEKQNDKLLTEFDCTSIEEKEHYQEIKQQNKKSNLLEHQEHKLPAQKCKSEKAIQEKRRIREIRAFWERDQTIPSHGEKEVNINANASGGHALKGPGESDKIKPTTVYLPNALRDQSKNTSRNPEPRCASQALGNKNHHTFEFGPGHAVRKPEGTLPSDEVHERAELPRASNLHPRAVTSASPKSKDKDDKETLKGKVAASQQKPSFQILSLKEKMNENSRNQISDPSQFQSLRNFWDTGVKFQSSMDRGDDYLPSNTRSITYERKSKEDKKGTDNASKQELIQQNPQISEREKTQKLDSMVCKKSLGSPTLKGLNVTHKKNAVSIQLDRKPVVSKSQENMGLPEQEVRECIEKNIVSSKDHHISLQLQSPGDKDALKETVVDDRLYLPIEKVDNKTAPLDKEEVAETVDKVVLPKGELDMFKSCLKKLEKEASEMSCSLNLKENILKGTTFHSNQCKVFERTVEDSHRISPADQGDEIGKSTGQVNASSTDKHENKKSLRKLFREFEPLYLQHQAAGKDDTLEGSQRPQDGLQYLRETFVSQPSEYRRVGKKTCDYMNSISQTSCSVESKCQGSTGELEEVHETREKSVAGSKVSDLSSALEKLLKEASETPPPKPKRADSIAWETAEVEVKRPIYKHGGEVPQEISENIEKSFAPSKVSGLSSALERLLKEASETPPPKPKRADSTVRRTAKVEAEGMTYEHGEEVPQEISETIDKSFAISKVSGLSSALEKLLKEASETPPPKPKCADSTVQRTAEVETAGMTFECDGEEQWAISETIEKSVAPCPDSGLSSALEKLLKESSETPPPKPKRADSTVGRTMDVEAKSTIYDHDGVSKELYKQEKFGDHIFLSEKETLFMTRSQPYNALSSYNTQMNSAIKGGAPEQNVKASVNDLAVSEIEASELKGDGAINKIGERNMVPADLPPLESKTNMIAIKPCNINEEGRNENTSLEASEQNSEFQALLNFRRTSTLKDESNFPHSEEVQFCRMSQHEDNDEEDNLNLGSKFSDENSDSHSGNGSSTRSEEELNPVLMALKRSADRKKPSKSLEDIPSATSNKEKINKPKEELILSAEDVSTVPSQPDKLFSNPEKLQRLSKSVPSFLQEESDDRETDTASESSYSFGRIKKSPSSLTNLSSSSGMASLSSVSGSLMSIYSADFGNVDVKGNIQFAIDYVEQLNELHVFICQCKDLAVADVKRQRSDPYVKTYLLPEKYRLGKRKTSVKKKTFNPVYNEILRYKIEKDLLKNQSLNISVWHNDTFGRNSFLGEVELDLGTWDWNDPSNKQIKWFPLKPRTSAITLNLENRGEMKLALQYVPHPTGGKKTTGEVHIWVKECHNLPLLRGNRLNSFIKCTILPDTSRKSRQKTRTVAKTSNPVFNHTMVYDGFRPEDLKEACIELTVWDHNKLANHFLGGLRIGLGTGKSYGTTVDWMDSTSDETALWEKMMNSPNTWIEDTLPLRMLMVAKLTK